jgi:hypothetical protein
MVFRKWLYGTVVMLLLGTGVLSVLLYKSVEKAGALEHELDHRERVIWSLQDALHNYEAELLFQQELLTENKELKEQLRAATEEVARRDRDAVEQDVEARAWAEQPIPAAVLERLRNP